MKSIFRRPLTICVVITLCYWAVTIASVNASNVPNFDKSVLLMAREQPVTQFIEELFGQIDTPVQVDGEIRGTVNGDFSKSARDVFSDIAASFQLTMYFDGAVAHVYPANDVKRSIVYMSQKAGQQVIDNARKLGLTDERNLLMVEDVGLVVTGTRRFAEQIQELSTAVQKNVKSFTTPDTYQVFKLKYAWADDVTLVVGGQEVVVPGVASLLRTLVEPGALGVPAAQSRTQLSPTQPGLRGQGLQAVGNDRKQGTAIGENAQASAIEPLSGTPSGSTQDTRIVADSLQNAIIIRDRPDRMAGYKTLIDSMDVEPRMIEIEATIIDMNTDRLRELGINWRLQDGDDEALLGNGTSSDQLLQPDTQITPQGQGGIVSLVLGNQTRFISRIRALETQGAARIVSKPHVITLSNVEALLDTTSTFFVRVAGQEEVDLFNVSVGTTLRVTPHVFDADGRSQIKLLVNIEDGSTSDQQVDQIPVIERSSINTQALIDAGQSLLIGGLVRDFKGNSVSKVPLLGNIPVLGALFRSNTKTSSRVERMFLITPRLNLRPAVGGGKRLSAPYLTGSESDILSTAPLRMEPAQLALGQRDETFPLPVELPRGGANATLKTPFTPAEILVPQTPDDSETEPVRRSLRQRLLNEDIDPPSLPQAPPPTDRVLQQHPPDIANEEGWQEVPNSSPAAIVPVSKGTSELKPKTVDHDEWQAISP